MESVKKSKKWLWIVIAIVAVLAVAGVVLGIVLSGGDAGQGSTQQGNTPKGGRADIYWNIDRSLYNNATTGMSNREAEADGSYNVTFAYEGEQVVYNIKDKRLVNFIDTADAVGLVFDDAGNVVDAVDVTTIANEMTKNFYVLQVEGNVITLNGSASFDGMTKKITCEDITKVYDFTGSRETKGQIVKPEDVQVYDQVTIYGNDLDQPTHVALMNRSPQSAIYWRAEQKYSYVLDTLGTTREPDENGIYTVEMFANGELVSLKFRNKEDVNNIDKVMANHAHFGLIFDEDGYVIGTQPSQNGIRGKISCNQYDVTEVNGRTFTAVGKVDTNYIDYTYTATVPEGVGVYDVSWRYSNALRGKDVGMVGVGDRITVWEDTLGNVVEIYIYIKCVPGPVCYRLDTLHNRQPDENGWFTIQMLVDGKVRNLKTKNEEICRFLEGNAYVALDLDGDVIKEAYNYTQVVRHAYTDQVKQGWSVSNIAGTILTLDNPTSTGIASKIMSSEMKVYNISGVHQEIGAETELQIGDRGQFISDVNGEWAYAFITSRIVEGDVYFNLDVKYDTREKCTSRVPDENGYYVFQMANGGKVVTIKTKSKAVASAIDAIGHQLVALNPDKNGIVKEAYDGSYATGGVVRMGGDYTFEGYTEDGQMQFARKVTPDVKVFYTADENTKVYNVSQVGFKKFRGETDTLEVGDQVLLITNVRNKVQYLYIVSSDAKTIKQYCPHCNKKVEFEPWIGTNLSLRNGVGGHLYLPGDGKDLTMNILGDHPNERAMDLVIDLRGNTVEFAEDNRGFIISNYIKLSIMDSKGGGRMIGGGVSGQAAGLIAGNNNSTINLYGGSLEVAKNHKNISLGGAVYVGGTALLNLNGGKIYSPDKSLDALYVDAGATVNINDGANIGSMGFANNTFVNMSGKVTISKLVPQTGALLDVTKLDKKSSIGIVARGPFTTEMSNPGDFLSIFSCPIDGGWVAVEGNQLACYGTEPDLSEVYELSQALDFSNPKKLPTYCPKCDKNVVWQPLPEQDKETSGANHLLPGNTHYYVPEGGMDVTNIYVLNSGDVCLHLADQTVTSTTGEIFAVFAGKTLTIMGDGKLKSTAVGTIASVLYNNGDINICGGTYESTAVGAMPVVSNLGNTGNVINIFDGEILAGPTSVNVRMQEANIFGGKIAGAVVTEPNGKLTVSGGTVELVKAARETELLLEGTPVIKKLTLIDGVLAQVGELATGAKIAVDVEGVFTTDFESEAAAQAAIKYFAGFEEDATIETEGNALKCVPAPFNYKKLLDKMNAQTFTGNAAGDAGYCYHCGENVTWLPITEATYITASGHYYLANDITNAADSTIVLAKAGGQNVCLHLNGKTVENTGSACSAILLWTNANQITIMGDGVVKNKSNSWAAFESRQDVENYIYGGTYINESANARAIQVAKGTTTLYGVDAADSLVFGTGGTVKLVDGTYRGIDDSVATSKIIVDGATVADVKVNTGSVEVLGGNIGNLTVSATATNLKISGKVIITKLDMRTATIKAEIGTLALDASIGVAAEGVFTTEFESEDAAQNVLRNFTSTIPGAEVQVDGKALTCTAPAFDYEAFIANVDAQTFTGNASGDAGYCYHCQNNVTWMPITEPVYNPASGHYYLANDIVSADANAPITLQNGKQICLHLNGKKLESTHAAASAILIWAGNNRINVMGSGTVKNAAANWGAFESRPDVENNIFGGTFINESGNRRAFQVYLGTTNIYGADAQQSIAYGVSTGTVNVVGGTYYGLYNAAAGKMIIDGATVGTATIDSGSVEVVDANITTMTVGAAATELKISGKTVISNLDVRNATIQATIGRLDTGAAIAVNADGVFTTEFADEAAAQDAMQYFTAAAKGATISREGKTLVCAAMTPVQMAEEAKKQTFTGTDPVTQYCYVCGTEATWQPITAATHIAANGHYFLANDITGTSSGEPALYTWGPTTTVCLHLNGKKVEHTNRLAAINNMKPIVLNVMGNGSLVAASSSYGTVVNQAAGSVNLYGTTVANNAGHQYGFTLTNGTMNLYNVNAEAGAVSATTGTVNIVSGKLLGVTVTAGQVNLSGAPVIPNLDMSAATTKLAVDKLTTGAAIAVNADGVFTGEIADVAAAKEFFSAVTNGKIIEIVGQTLSCVNAG